MKLKRMLAALLACAMAVTAVPANLTTILAQDLNVGTAAAAVSEDAWYELPEIDCDDFRSAHTEGVSVDAYGVTITMDTQTYSDAEDTDCTPGYVLYHGDGQVYGEDYDELFVNRSDLRGWEPGDINAGNDTGSGNSKNYDTSLTDVDWDQFLADNMEGTEVTIYARMVGDNVVVEMQNAGAVSIATIAAGDETVYLSLTGKQCTLTNIQVGEFSYPQYPENEDFRIEGNLGNTVFVGDSIFLTRGTSLAFYDLQLEEYYGRVDVDNRTGRITGVRKGSDWVDVYALDYDDAYISLGDVYLEILDDKLLDLADFRAAHSDGVQITEAGAELGYTARSYCTADDTRETPSYVLYQGYENQVDGAGYRELFINRSDGYGWASDGTDTEDYEGSSIIQSYDTTALEDEDEFLAENKAGTEGKVEAVLIGDEVVIRASNAGVVSTATIKVDRDMPVYLSLTGEHCVLYDYYDSELMPMRSVKAELKNPVYLGSPEQILLSDYEPLLSDHTVHFRVRNEDIASVDENGVVTGKAAGETWIDIYNADWNFMSSCALTVSDRSAVSQGAYDTDLTDNGKVTYVVTPYEDNAVVGLYVYDSEMDDLAEDYYNDPAANGFATTSDGVSYFYNESCGDNHDITVETAKSEDGKAPALAAGKTYEVTVTRFGRDFTVTYTDITNNQVFYTYTVKHTALLDQTKAHFEKLFGDCEVYVKGQAPTQLTAVHAAEQNIAVGEKILLAVETDSTNVDPKQMTFTSSDPTVLSVSSTGEVTGVKAGTATVSVVDKAGKLTKVTSEMITVVAATETTVLSGTESWKTVEKSVAYGAKDQVIAVLCDGYAGRKSDLSYEWTLGGKLITTEGIQTGEDFDEEGNSVPVYDNNIKAAVRDNRLEIASITEPISGLTCTVKAKGRRITSVTYTYRVSTNLKVEISGSQTVEAKDGKATFAVTASVDEDTVPSLNYAWYVADSYRENSSVSNIEPWDWSRMEDTDTAVPVENTTASWEDTIEADVTESGVYKVVVSDGVGNAVTKYFGANVADSYEVHVSRSGNDTLTYEKDEIETLKDKAVLKADVTGYITVRDEGKSAYVAKTGDFSCQWQSSRTGAEDSYQNIEGATGNTYTVTAAAKNPYGPYYRYVVTNNASTAVPKTAKSDYAVVRIMDAVQVQEERSAYYAAKGSNVTLKVYAQVEEDFAVEKYQWYQWVPEDYEWVPADAAAAKDSADMTYSVCEVSNIAGGEKYYCKVTDSVGNTWNSQEISVAPSDGIEYQSSLRNVTVKKGEKASLSIYAVAAGAGEDKVTYQWKIRTYDSANGWVYTDLANAKSSDYTTDALDQNCQYRCVLSDGTPGNEINVDFSVSVQEQASLIAVDKSKLADLNEVLYYGYDSNTLTVIKGQRCDLEVGVRNAAANATVTYAWYKNGAALTKDGAPCTTAKITTDKIAQGDRYSCTVSDGTANRTVSYGFNLKTKLSCSPVEDYKYIPYGQGQELKANVIPIYGTTVSYQWYLVTENGDVELKGAHADTYGVVNLEKANTQKTYKCVVTDQVTTEEVLFDVSLEGGSDSAEEVINLALTYDQYYKTYRYVAKGSKQTLTVTAAADPADAALTYQWYKVLRNQWDDNHEWNDDHKIAGATEASYVTTAVEADEVYICEVTAASDKYKEPVTRLAYFYLSPVAQDDEDVYLNVRRPSETIAALGETLSVSADAINGTVYTTWYKEDINNNNSRNRWIKVGTDASYTPSEAGVYHAVAGTNEKGTIDTQRINYTVIDFSRASAVKKDTAITGYISSQYFLPLYKFTAAADDHVTGQAEVLDKTGRLVSGELAKGKTYYIRPTSWGEYEYEYSFRICTHKNAVSTTITTANCADGAIVRKVCEDCGVTTYDKGDADTKAHALGAVTVKGQTLYYICRLCGQIFMDKAAAEAEDTVISATHTHTMAKTEAKSASCTEAGNIAYHTCSVCGKFFQDADGSAEIKKADTIILALGHSVRTITQSATCTENGIETYYQCTTCGKFFVDPECTEETTETDAQKKAIPATGHDYLEPEFTWAEDGRTAVYAYVCANNSSEVMTGDAVMTSKSIKKETCTAMGLCAYTASVTVDEKTYTASKTVITKATGHTYETVVTKATPAKNGSIEEKCVMNDSTKSTTIIDQIGTVTLAKTSYTYNGEEQKPAVTVKDVKGQVIAEDNYTVSYKANKDAGTAMVTVTFKGDRYSGKVDQPFKINGVEQTIKKVITSKKIKLSKVKAKKQTFKLGGKAKGALSYKKTSGNSKIKVSSKGVVTVAKGMGKGTYKIKVAVTAKADKNYKKTTVTKTIKITVK